MVAVGGLQDYFVVKKDIAQKPEKLNDTELFHLIFDKISAGNYIFLKHARQRQKDRGVTDLDVLNILKGGKNRKIKRNKRKDKYEQGKKDWNYCIEGFDIDGKKIRIIVSFNEELLLIITVIRPY